MELAEECAPGDDQRGVVSLGDAEGGEVGLLEGEGGGGVDDPQSVQLEAGGRREVASGHLEREEHGAWMRFDELVADLTLVLYLVDGELTGVEAEVGSHAQGVGAEA